MSNERKLFRQVRDALSAYPGRFHGVIAEIDAYLSQPQAAAWPLKLDKDEAVAHMLPRDLERFKTREMTAQAYSVAVSCEYEHSVPLFTEEQVRAAISKVEQPIEDKS